MTRVTDINCYVNADDMDMKQFTCSIETGDIDIMEHILSLDDYNPYMNFTSPLLSQPGKSHIIPEIEDVIFNPPATIVFWSDGTKTVVKQQPCDMAIDDNDNLSFDNFSKETGLSMAICKKAMGNKGNYNDVFNKWIWDKE